MAKKKSTILTIDPKDMERYRREGHEKAAQNLAPETVVSIIEQCRRVVDEPVDIDEYKPIADALAETLDAAYDEVGSPNLFHHPLKQISPEIYGQANTLRKYAEHLLDDMKAVRKLQVRAKGGK